MPFFVRSDMKGNGLTMRAVLEKFEIYSSHRLFLFALCLILAGCDGASLTADYFVLHRVSQGGGASFRTLPTSIKMDSFESVVLSSPVKLEGIRYLRFDVQLASTEPMAGGLLANFDRPGTEPEVYIDLAVRGHEMIFGWVFDAGERAVVEEMAIVLRSNNSASVRVSKISVTPITQIEYYLKEKFFRERLLDLKSVNVFLVVAPATPRVNNGQSAKV